MRLDSNVITRANPMNLIIRFRVGLEGVDIDALTNCAIKAARILGDVFISGFGNIGVELAKRLRPFGVKIIAAKRSWASHSQVCCQSSDGETVLILLIFKSMFFYNIVVFYADIVGSLLVNIVRGGLLDYEVVAHYLESGHLGGLGLDVAWTKPFDPNNPILKFQIVLITPHVGGVTEHSYRSTAKVVGDVALQLHAGTPLRGIEPVN
ncbi:D-isomer specific 2-hydroxyacid dehydrogenase family protein [Citrus sinensis]|nr:D-isomer specific 2-hydroxyacid dehydrogenase family protein [Citrus sinensis]